jgi:AraC family transcriptional regulator of arabinose operon
MCALSADTPIVDATVEALARRVNLSPSRLRHLFKNELGVSITGFVKLQRLRQAQQLLGTTFLSVKEIVALVGAGDESHFVRAFKDAVGQTPSEYRRYSKETRSAVSAPDAEG